MLNLAENSFGIIALVFFMAFLPLIAVTVTAFAKIAIVLMIVRNATGLQNLPPNVVMYGLAIILSAYIAFPIVSDSFERVQNTVPALETAEDWIKAGEEGSAPLKEFLKKHADEKQTAFFLSSTRKIWGDKYADDATPDDLVILVPSFLLSELTKAFEIGFLLFLPFIAIDIIVTTVLIALGMMMVPPSTIAIPFKLMLFVFVEGWSKIVQGLLLTYA